MRHLSVVFVLALLIAGVSLAMTPGATVSAACSGSTYVRGYFRSNGTYISGYWRTCPDAYRWNNYSSWGNYNPYTGRYGSRYDDSFNYGYRPYSYYDSYYYRRSQSYSYYDWGW